MVEQLGVGDERFAAFEDANKEGYRVALGCVERWYFGHDPTLGNGPAGRGEGRVGTPAPGRPLDRYVSNRRGRPDQSILPSAQPPEVARLVGLATQELLQPVRFFGGRLDSQP